MNAIAALRDLIRSGTPEQIADYIHENADEIASGLRPEVGIVAATLRAAVREYGEDPSFRERVRRTLDYYAARTS